MDLSNVQAVSLESALLFLVFVGFLAAVRRIVDYRAAVVGIQNHPGYRVFISPASILGSIIPRIKGLALGGNFGFDQKHEPFEQAGWDVVSAVSLWPTVTTVLFVADAGLIKQIASSRHHWPKPDHLYRPLTFFGKNIVASEGEDWKRYRKVTAPAFSDRNNHLVWDETCHIMLDLFDNVWGDKDEIRVDHCAEVTVQITMAVIGVAGFGQRMALTDDLTIPAGHRLTFKDALRIVSTGTTAKIIFPNWMMNITSGLAKVQLGFDELNAYMLEMVQARLAGKAKEERHDLFSNLLAANDEDVEVKLSTPEVIGNMFIYQLAGHETSAHTLAFAFVMLALYPAKQEKLYEHIKSVLPVGRSPTYEEMPLFTYSMAVFNETTRLFPVVPMVPKVSPEDTVITATNAAGERKTIPVPKGTYVVLDTPAVHHNPRYWENPYDFKPERFMGDWPRDAFMTFSAGARACIGRKFAETEGVAVLTLMVSRYKIELVDEPQFAHETWEQKRARLTAARMDLGLRPFKAPLVFRRR